MTAEWRAKQRSLRSALALQEAEAETKMKALMAGLRYQKLKVNKAVEKVSQLKGALVEYEKVNSQPSLDDIKISIEPIKNTDMVTNLD